MISKQSPKVTKIFRKIHIHASILVLVSGMLPGIAAACEGGGEEVAGGIYKFVRQRGTLHDECEFRVLNERCTIIYEVKESPKKWEIRDGELKGIDVAEYYTKASEGCTAGKKGFKKGEKCQDEIELIKKEIEALPDEYCVTFREEAFGTETPTCTELKM